MKRNQAVMAAAASDAADRQLSRALAENSLRRQMNWQAAQVKPS